ncbi:MAG: adenylate/guanylate cyclase domain-containing protein [Elusimicrobiaceae bacterium]|nr:adenylate/guanylate cyclase domain-containing protein [Elusimicrobiaceae bacterium]
MRQKRRVADSQVRETIFNGPPRRVGISPGRVIQGGAGPENRKNLTVPGDPVSTAARLETIAKPNSPCISEITWSCIKTRDGFEFAGRELLKSKREPIPVYRLIETAP